LTDRPRRTAAKAHSQWQADEAFPADQSHLKTLAIAQNAENRNDAALVGETL